MCGVASVVTVHEEENQARGGTLPPWSGMLACAGIGVAAAVLSLLPWLVTGMRLPLQNLWAVQTMPEDMPIVLLPFSQYAITLLLGLVVIAYGAAGIVVRALRTRLPHRAGLAIGAGVLAVHLVATVQTATTVASGLVERAASTVYLAALAVLFVVAVLTGLLVLRLITAPPRAGAVIGLSLVALLFGPWVAALVSPMGTVPDEVAYWALTTVVRWLPAVLVGAAIAWGGLETRGRVVAAVGSLLLLWVGPASITAVTSAAGSRVLLRYPAEVLDYGLQVLRAAMFLPELVVPRLLVALVVAAAGIGAHRLIARHRTHNEA